MPNTDNFIKAIEDSDFNDESDLLHEGSVTENGMLGFSSTDNPIVDTNFALSSMRSWEEEKITEAFLRCLKYNELMAVKWLFMIGDIRQGAGERRTFNVCLQALANKKPKLTRELIKLIPVYARWDYLCKLATKEDVPTNVRYEALNEIKSQLEADLEAMKENEPISLLGKWLPSNNTSSKQTRHEAYIIRTFLEMTESEYRKTLSKLRKYLNVIETFITEGRWNEIDYSQVPSKANIKYSKQFLVHDRERREGFLQRAFDNEDGAKLNASVTCPYEIVDMYTRYIKNKALDLNLSCDAEYQDDKRYFDIIKEKVEDNIEYETLWKSLSDFTEGKDIKTLCVLDSSGSMTMRISSWSTVTSLDIARSLTIYFSERLSSAYKNTCLEFSRTTRFIKFDEDSLCKKLIELFKYNDCSNTNLELVFDKILEVAINNNLKQEDLPTNVLIISDMEFDSAARCNLTRGQQVYNNVVMNAQKKYKKAGYKLPGLVFWNIRSRTNTIPVKKNENGLVLLSGFSPSMIKMVLSGEIDPAKALYKLLDSERYQPIEEAYKRAYNLK